MGPTILINVAPTLFIGMIHGSKFTFSREVPIHFGRVRLAAGPWYGQPVSVRLVGPPAGLPIRLITIGRGLDTTTKINIPNRNVN